MDRLLNAWKAQAAAMDRSQGQARFGVVTSADPGRHAVRVQFHVVARAVHSQSVHRGEHQRHKEGVAYTHHRSWYERARTGFRYRRTHSADEFRHLLHHRRNRPHGDGPEIDARGEHHHRQKQIPVLDPQRD